MEQKLTLILNPAQANKLIEVLNIAMRTSGYEAAVIAVPIINDLIKQDQEFKAQNTESAEKN